MQGSMKSVALLAAVFVTLVVAAIAVGTSHAATTGCSDARFSNAMVKANGYAMKAMSYGSTFRWTAAKQQATVAWATAVAAPTPCASTLRPVGPTYTAAMKAYITAYGYGEQGRITSATTWLQKGNTLVRQATALMRAYAS